MKKKRSFTADYREDYLLNDLAFPPETSGIRVHSFCHSLWQPNYRPDSAVWLFRPLLLVSMILAGEEDYIDEEGDRIVRKPGFFSISDLNYDKDPIHKRKHPLERYFVLFQVNEFLRGILQDLFPTGFPQAVLPNPGRMKSCFEDIRRVLRKKGEQDNVLLGAMGFRLLCEASRQFSTRPRIPEPLSRAVHYMGNLFCNAALKRTDVAKAAGISVASLGKLFQEHFHETVNQRILSLRLEKAKHLLKHTELPIAEIASQCGFSYSYYFSRVFKEKNGILPGDYRRRNDEIRRKEPASG